MKIAFLHCGGLTVENGLLFPAPSDCDSAIAHLTMAF